MRRQNTACDGGDAKSCIQLGQLYRHSFFATDGVASDGDHAFELFQHACGLGSVEGCSELGWCYDEGMGVRHDASRAEELFQKGCDAGYLASCGLLGLLYKTDSDGAGRNPKRDLKRARALFERVCAGPVDGLGCLSGCNDLAGDYFYGDREQSVAKDHPKAVALYQRACGAGCPNSCDSGARMLRDADEVPRDYARAAELYQRACDLGFAPSCVDLGELYRDGNGVARSHPRARQLFKRGCKKSGGQVERCHGDVEAGPLLRTL